MGYLWLCVCVCVCTCVCVCACVRVSFLVACLRLACTGLSSVLFQVAHPCPFMHRAHVGVRLRDTGLDVSDISGGPKRGGAAPRRYAGVWA